MCAMFQTDHGFIFAEHDHTNDELPSLVFINSLGTDTRLWTHIHKILKPHFNILRFDKPGHGLSPLNDRHGTIEHYAHCLIALLDQLSIIKTHIVGLSIGGLIAQHIAIHFPQYVDRLILTNTASRLGTDEFWQDRINLIQRNGVHSIIEPILARWFAPSFANSHPARFQMAKVMLSQASNEGYIAACEALRDADYTAKLSQIRAQTLCIAGSNDLSSTTEQVRAMSQSIALSQFHEFDNVGHIPCLEVPEKFSSLVHEFLVS